MEWLNLETDELGCKICGKSQITSKYNEENSTITMTIRPPGICVECKRDEKINDILNG